MSSPTQPTAQRIAPASGPAGRIVPDAAELLQDIRIEARRGGPPHEVLVQMRRAARIHEHLRASGLHIGFELPPGEPPLITLRGADGETLRTLSALQASDIAAGLAGV